MKKIIILMFVLIGTLSFGMEIRREILTEGIENREPVSEMSTFKTNDTAYYFIEAINIGEETNVYYIWSHVQEDGKLQEMAKVKLRVKGSRWRTWSSKNLFLPGTWVVEVVDAEGTLLVGKEFLVEDEDMEMDGM